MDGAWPSSFTPEPDEQHDLRITGRCRTDDLEEDSESELVEVAARHDIVEHFLELRASQPSGGERISSVASEAEIYAVRRTAKVGATWHDVARHVVWLLALASEGQEAFDYFASLHERRALLPSEEDYERLISEQLAQLAPALLVELSALLSNAKDADGDERAYVLIDGTIAGLVAVFEDDVLTDLWAALHPRRRTPLLPGHFLGALLPANVEGRWKSVRRLPHRNLRENERAYRFCPTREP